MGRAIFSYEIGDQDFSWLLSNFKENHPEFYAVEIPGLPLVFFRASVTQEKSDATRFPVPATDVPPDAKERD